MRARCPHCTTVFNTDRGGVQFCPSCGKQINVPAAPPAGAETGGPGGPSGDPSAAPAGSAPAGTPSYGATGSGGSQPPPPPPPPSFGSAGQYAPPPPPGNFEEAPTAWEQRSTLGFFKGYFGTVKDSCFAPERFWKTTSPTRSWTDALYYAWITNVIALLLGSPLTLLQMRNSANSAAEMPEEMRAFFDALSNPAIIAAYLLGTILLYPVLFVISTGITHLLCMLFGAGKNGFNATARGVGYASAPLLIASIPCVGLGGAIYYMVLLVWGVATLQRTEWWRPLLAILLPVILICCCGGLAIAVAAGAAAGR